MALTDFRAIAESLVEHDIPDNLVEGIAGYIADGIPTGDFLQAVFAHDLFDAVARADHHSELALFALVQWIYNNAPAGCHGSRDKIEAWLELHRARREAAGEEDEGHENEALADRQAHEIHGDSDTSQ